MQRPFHLLASEHQTTSNAMVLSSRHAAQLNSSRFIGPTVTSSLSSSLNLTFLFLSEAMVSRWHHSRLGIRIRIRIRISLQANGYLCPVSYLVFGEAAPALVNIQGQKPARMPMLPSTNHRRTRQAIPQQHE